MADPGYPNCRFYVTVNGITAAVFTEVSGLQLETEIFEYAEGGNNQFVHRLPGRMKSGNLTLKRGMTASADFFAWCAEIGTGKVMRRAVTVTLYDAKGQQVTRWKFDDAFPVKWTGPQLAAGAAEMAIETLELAHNGIHQE